MWIQKYFYEKMLKAKTIWFLLLLTLIKVCFSDGTVQVNLKQGILLGTVEKTLFKKQNYYAFKGIPYAASPTEKLRFMPPTAHQSWDDIYEAFDNKPTCLQFSARMRNDEPFGISGSEDCLYISVYTPHLQGSKPVIVFDYNDSFKTWFNGTKTYSPELFMEEDVIVVTISHRLGIFGYLTTEDDVIPGNIGLRDFIFGLGWIKNNINEFGGNPDRVTLMGSCGGAALADMLLYSKKAKGLFSAAVIQSGTAFETAYFFKNSRAKTFEYGEQIDIKTNDSKILLEQLQKVDAEKLLAKVVNVLGDKSAKDYQVSSHYFVPTIEKDNPDAVLTYLPEDGDIVNDVPVLIGFNSREGLDFTSHFILDPKLLTDDVEKGMLHFPIRPSFRFDRESMVFDEARREIIEFYMEDKNLNYGNILEYAVYAGDVLLNYALNQAVYKLASNLESSVYYYVFDFRGQLNENSQYLQRHSFSSMKHSGATVGDELCYLHVCSRIRRDYEQLSKMASEQNEHRVLKKMVRMWANFAKTRNPTPNEKDDVLKDFVWEPVKKDGAAMNYLHITKKLHMKTNPLGDRGKFWDDFLAKYSQMAVDGVVQDAKQRDEL